VNSNGINEGFDKSTLNPQLFPTYQKFLPLMTDFMTAWRISLITSQSMTTTIQPLAKPSDRVTSIKPPEPTEKELNDHAKVLSQTEGKEFPSLTPLTPFTTEDELSIPLLQKTIPLSEKPYLNALKWMNDTLEKSHASLNMALKGSQVDGFDGEAICQQIIQCQAKQSEDVQQQLIDRMKKFTDNQELLDLLKKNKELIEKSKQIKNQAQSGTLPLNLPKEASTTFTLPDGADKLKQLCKNDPAKCELYQSKYKHLFAFKSLSDQINGSLR
jgi:hypothetical protein